MDLISSEYGWGDEVILDLTLPRLRQVLGAIAGRLEAEERRARRLVGWSTKTLAQFIAATVEVAPGKTNHLARAADNISVDIVAPDLDVSSDETALGPPGRSARSDDRGGAGNAVGSYERAMTMLGRGFSPPSEDPGPGSGEAQEAPGG